MYRLKFKLAAAVSSILICLNPSLVQASKPGVIPLSTKAAEVGVSSTWSCSHQWPPSYAIVKFCIGSDGKIYNPELTHSSGDEQYDAECAESICALSPLERQVDNQTSGYLINPSFRFDKEQNAGIPFSCKPQFDGADVREYLKTHPEPADSKNSFVLVHKIPISLLIRHPDMFRKEELLNPSNLVEIRAKSGLGFVSKIANFYAKWGDLLKDPNVSKDLILQFAKQMPDRKD